ncbi:Fc receptor-like protein 1 isoform X2 [Prinia subflava]|uniref:Fc receptor-like protein 1 isoform X2 n=1 Tax=Prinia subflava TaxID=208062 RepID=UPI002FE10C16
MAGKVALLLWAQTLGLAGARTTQLLVDPPWRPAVLWDQVTVTCWGSGTTGATTWYKDRQRWWKKGPSHFTVTESGTYTCDRPGTGPSPPIYVLNDWLVLQVPARVLLEGDTVTLRCRGWKDGTVTGVRFYHEGKDLVGPLNGTELSLSPLQLHHSGHYHCGGRVNFPPSPWWEMSAPVAVTVTATVTAHGVLLLRVSLWAQPRGAQVALGDRLVLSCTVAAGTGPLSFTWHRGGSGEPLGTGSHLELHHTGDKHSVHYECQASNGDIWPRAPHLPVANATITPGPLSHQVHSGDPMTLHCSVQVGSAPVTFTWLHNGEEVARGPVLELGNVNVTHSGTYQCVATNQLDDHSVFRALSPKLALEVTPWGHWNTVAAGVIGSLLFLVLLMGIIVALHWWQLMDARKHQERTPPDSLAPPGDDPQTIYMELKGPHGQPWEPSDIYEHLQQKL